MRNDTHSDWSCYISHNRKLISNLFNACKNGKKDIVKYLVKHGADINKENKEGETPLFNACYSGKKDLVEYLVEHGADINKEVMKNGKTLLFTAWVHGKKDMKEYLLKYGAHSVVNLFGDYYFYQM